MARTTNTLRSRMDQVLREYLAARYGQAILDDAVSVQHEVTAHVGGVRGERELLTVRLVVHAEQP